MTMTPWHMLVDNKKQGLLEHSEKTNSKFAPENGWERHELLPLSFRSGPPFQGTAVCIFRIFRDGKILSFLQQKTTTR